MTKPKAFEETHVIIKCVDCGKDRTIRKQDLHQVIRCKECQRKYRISRRSEMRNSK